MRRRQRSSTLQVDNDQIHVFDQDSEGANIGRWTTTGTGLTGEMTEENRKSIMIDEPKPKFSYGSRNCDHYDHVVHSWLTTSCGLMGNQDRRWISVPSIGSDTLVGEGRSFPACRLRGSVRTEPPIASWAMDQIPGMLSDNRLPTEVVITKNPFDEDFSIWMLLVDIWDLVTGFMTAAPRLLKRRAALRRMHHVKSPSARDLHNASLGTQFGVIPTIADARKFLEVLSHFVNQAEHVKAISDKLHRYRLEPVTLWPFKDDLEFETVAHISGYTFPIRCEIRTVVPAQWHGTLYYTMTCPIAKGILANVKRAIDMFGVLDPNAIWDVIPFSFVLDWLIDIGSWLHHHTPRLYPVSVKVVDYCESVSLQFDLKWRIPGSLRLCSDASSIGPGASRVRYLNDVEFCRESYSYYTRRRLIPKVRTGAPPLGFHSPFSLRRVSIASSLIAQRVSRGSNSRGYLWDYGSNRNRSSGFHNR